MMHAEAERVSVAASRRAEPEPEPEPMMPDLQMAPASFDEPIVDFDLQREPAADAVLAGLERFLAAIELARHA